MVPSEESAGEELIEEFMFNSQFTDGATIGLAKFRERSLPSVEPIYMVEPMMAGEETLTWTGGAGNSRISAEPPPQPERNSVKSRIRINGVREPGFRAIRG